MARSRGEKEESFHDKNTGFLKLLQVVSFLVVFVVGVVIGLVTSAHINRHLGAQTETYSFINHFSSSSKETTPPETNYCPAVVQNCEKVDCLSMATFLEPNKNLTHGMSDNELFWRASFVPGKKEYPYERVPKVAFLFMTRGPLPLMLLWERFFQGHDNKLFSVYVHVVPGYRVNASTTSPFYRREIPSQPVSWGSVTLVDAERHLLANALLDFSNERFVLLSESCIPVYNFPTVYKYLTGSKNSFVESYDDAGRFGRGRYSRRMLPGIQLYQWRKGSQWFELGRTLAAIIVAEVRYYTVFSKYCLPACYPDEHYMATYFNMFHGSLNSNRTVTWVDWSVGGPHPAMYGGENVTEDFVRSIRNNGALCQYNSEMTSICNLFARKFAPTALEPLLELASSVMEF
ncbi:hypothetical protein ACLB2K_052971 [Fragaria x ananassa]